VRVLDRDIDILFTARSSKKEAAARAIFLHAIGDGVIAGALWNDAAALAGYGRVFPRLAGNGVAQAGDPISWISIILNGASPL
jgi:hypothetical protein